MGPVLTGDEYDLLETIPGPLVAADKTGRIQWANAELCALLNHEHPDDLVDRPITDLMPERFVPKHEKGFHHYLKTGHSRLLGKRIQVRALAPPGQEVTVELCIRMFRRPDGSDLIVGAMQPAGSDEDILDFCVLRLEEDLATHDYESH
jgi:PAS domain S-box-containing protein